MIVTGLGSEVDKFLNAISSSEDNANGKLGSSARSYRPGLALFAKFLSEQSLNKESEFKTVKDISAFFKAVEKDQAIKVKTNRKFPDRELLKQYGADLAKQKVIIKGYPQRRFAEKSVRAYVGSVQALFHYYDISISTAYSDLPSGSVENLKFAWSLQLVGDFIQSFDSPLYRCLAVWFLESGLSNIDLLRMTYGTIKSQYENDVNPFCLNMVRWKTKKFQIKFRAFVGSQGIRYFREYYDSLDKALSDDDLLFDISSVSIQKYFERRSKYFLAKVQPKDDSAKKQQPEKKLRNLCVPSSLRTAMRTFLTDAKIEDDVIEYFMGHGIGDIGKTYLNRSDDSWRAFWKKDCERFLTFKETKIA